MQGENDLFHIPGFKQIDRLEDLVVWEAVGLDGFLERGHVLHEGKVASLLVDSLHAARLQLVDEAEGEGQIYMYVFESQRVGKAKLESRVMHVQ